MQAGVSRCCGKRGLLSQSQSLHWWTAKQAMWASHFVGPPCFLTVLCREALGECCAAMDTGHSWGMWSWWCLFKAHMFSSICFPVGFYELSPVWTTCAWSLIESCLACLVCFFIFDFYQWLFFLIAEFSCIHSNTLLFKNQNVAAFFSLSFHSVVFTDLILCLPLCEQWCEVSLCFCFCPYTSVSSCLSGNVLLLHQ